MHLLLDTHALIWWLADDAALSRPAKTAIADMSNAAFVSAATAWEIATKVRKGRLPGTAALAADIAASIAAEGFAPLPVTVEHGQRAGALPGRLNDPFDRMLVAQAMLENLHLVSIERAFAYGVLRLW